MRLSTEIGSYVMLGGWLESLFIVSLYGLYFPLAKSKAMSRKFTMCEYFDDKIFKISGKNGIVSF